MCVCVCVCVDTFRYSLHVKFHSKSIAPSPCVKKVHLQAWASKVRELVFDIVKPVLRGHPICTMKVTRTGRWPKIRGSNFYKLP